MISGEMLIGATLVKGNDGSFRAVNPATGEQLEPEFGQGGGAEVDRAAELAWEAFDTYRATSPEERASFLDLVAAKIEGSGEAIIERGHLETGLPVARLTGELGRTTGQLRLFARLLRGGTAFGVRIDRAQPERQPAPRPDLRQQLLPLGPVAVFGASNFPLAFSNAGGDTAAALAAGCPVVVKVHNAHPGTAMLVSAAVAEAVRESGLPEGVYSALIGSGRTIGQGLVAHPRIKAVGFTGSRSGGLALVETASKRPEPIPVYAEMSSTNPVVVFPGRAGKELAASYVGSLTMGAGQFCTNPGLTFVPTGPDGDAFVAEVSRLIDDAVGQTMLSSGIREAFDDGVSALSEADGVTTLARGTAGEGENAPDPVVFEADAARLATDEVLTAEIFGAAGLILRYRSIDELLPHLEGLEGQLTATIQAEPADDDAVRRVLPVLERRVGRILYNGWPTGVEVTHAQVHGGPYPATADGRSTSVGTHAITRFQRPVAYQDIPDRLLPGAIADGNPWQQVRLVDGEVEAS